MITFQIANLYISKPNAKLQKHSISKLDLNKFTSLLNDQNVEDILNCNDTNVAISKFVDYVKDDFYSFLSIHCNIIFHYPFL